MAEAAAKPAQEEVLQAVQQAQQQAQQAQQASAQEIQSLKDSLSQAETKVKDLEGQLENVQEVGILYVYGASVVDAGLNCFSKSLLLCRWVLAPCQYHKPCFHPTI